MPFRYRAAETEAIGCRRTPAWKPINAEQSYFTWPWIGSFSQKSVVGWILKTLVLVDKWQLSGQRVKKKLNFQFQSLICLCLHFQSCVYESFRARKFAAWILEFTEATMTFFHAGIFGIKRLLLKGIRRQVTWEKFYQKPTLSSQTPLDMKQLAGGFILLVFGTALARSPHLSLGSHCSEKPRNSFVAFI